MSAALYHSPTNSGWLKKIILTSSNKDIFRSEYQNSQVTINGHSVKAKDHSYKLQWKCKPHKYANRKRVNLQNKIDKEKFILSKNGFLICHVLDDK
jgi:hypothetical protein